MKYIITHKKFGERAKYSSLTAAQEAIQAKGPKFEDTELAESPDKFQTEEHRVRLVYNSKQVKELILTFDPTVTREQKAYLAERLDYFIVNFEELAAEAKQTSAEEDSDTDL